MVGHSPVGVAITPDDSRAYVANFNGDSVSVIATATNSVVATVPVGSAPYGVTITPDGTRAYVVNEYDGTVSVIATATNIVVATVTVGNYPNGVAITPDGTRVYVVNSNDSTVSVIATATNTVVATVTVGDLPEAVAITPGAVLTKSFNPATIPVVGGTTELTFTVTNSSSAALTGAEFTDVLPCHLVVVPPLVGSCGVGTITAVAGSNTVSLTGGSIPANSSCTFTVTVASAVAGVCLNTTSPLTTTQFGTGLPANATLYVATPPNLTKVFGELSIGSLGTTSITFTLTNPNPSVTLTGLGFNDLPSGLVVATPNGLTGSCDGGVITAVAGSNSITLSGATLAPLASCTFSVNVASDGTVLGYVTATSTVTSDETLPSVAPSATLFIGDPFLVSYKANLNIGESYIDITNTGVNGAPLLGPGLGAPSGNICVNVYAFDPNEELVSCCSCLITPDQTVNLGANRDLTAKTLTGAVPTSLTVKLLATLAGAGGSGTSCSNSAATVTSATLANGAAAWGTTLHATPTSGSYATTETPFIGSTLSAGELTSIGGRCAAIIGNASGFGICTSCQSGVLGAAKF
jgi:YVTN family beta-propeller protein